MAISNQHNAYLNNHYEGMSPNQLILLLYQGALKNLRLAREGILEENPKKRGEHMSKAIAIVSELNASLNSEMKDDLTEFLRGLYGSILVELPKVSLNNDIKILDTTAAYITKLKEIWEKDVMGKKPQKEMAETKAPEAPKQAAPAPPAEPAPISSPPRPAAYGAYGGGGGYGGQTSRIGGGTSFSA